MRPVDAKALTIIAFALTGRIVLLGLILRVGREYDVPLINLIWGYLISCSPHKTVSIVRTGRTGCVLKLGSVVYGCITKLLASP